MLRAGHTAHGAARTNEHAGSLLVLLKCTKRLRDARVTKSQRLRSALAKERPHTCDRASLASWKHTGRGNSTRARRSVRQQCWGHGSHTPFLCTGVLCRRKRPRPFPCTGVLCMRPHPFLCTGVLCRRKRWCSVCCKVRYRRGVLKTGRASWWWWFPFRGRKQPSLRHRTTCLYGVWFG